MTPNLNSLGFSKPPQNTRIVAAMSGGVDSSVVAGLLAAEGYEVIGITLQLYNHGAAIRKKGACCAGQDIHDAKRVAEQLGIPHYVLDYEERFRRKVIEDFAETYAQGETPIPCVRCNERVKFGDLLELARELGADALATGHYARRLMGESGPELHRAVDETRDQSYFLFATTREQLDYLRFPLGAVAKSEVRKMASDLGLGVAEKPDSQDICFVPEGRYTDVVKRVKPDTGAPGEIVDSDGRVLGQHPGIIHFTVGQRKYLGLPGQEHPLFVVSLDARTRRVIVGPREALRTRKISLRAVNWLGELRQDHPLRCLVKVRSSRAPVMALVTNAGGNAAEVELVQGEDAVAPGQACVFYEESSSRVLGGGWIARVEPVRRHDLASPGLLNERTGQGELARS